MASLADYAKTHPDINPDFTIDQGWDHYTPEEHDVWRTLYRRQADVLPGRAAPEFLEGLTRLDLGEDRIPDFRRLNDELFKLTGWTVVAVPGLVPDDVFFEHLANRRFVAGQFIRKPEQLDYLQEPDIFHDVFGHVPLLANPVFADYMEAYGKGGLRALGFHTLHNLARLYWYTVEFGLIETSDGLRIYGAGIVSSKGESIFSLEDPSPNRVHFDLIRLMRTKYRIDDYQQTYFVISDFKELFDATVHKDFAPIYEAMGTYEDVEPETVLKEDRIHHRGTQDYARAKAGLS
ncbi:MAG: phenylalanine 4-monooxygenase [Alphaproteobacteria bacterium]